MNVKLQIQRIRTNTSTLAVIVMVSSVIALGFWVSLYIPANIIAPNGQTITTGDLWTLVAFHATAFSLGFLVRVVSKGDYSRVFASVFPGGSDA